MNIPMSIPMNIHWKDWCWSWNFNTLATWCEELTHKKRPWCWETLKVGGEGDDRGWDGWMVSPTQWTWVWVDSGNWWWTGRPGMLRLMGSQTVRHNWVTELNWSEIIITFYFPLLINHIFPNEPVLLELSSWTSTTEPAHLEPVLHSNRSQCNEKPMHCNEE